LWVRDHRPPEGGSGRHIAAPRYADAEFGDERRAPGGRIGATIGSIFARKSRFSGEKLPIFAAIGSSGNKWDFPSVCFH
jgi:hypothetical protein